MNAYALLMQLLQMVIALALAPLFLGWINQCRAWLQNRSAPAITQPYRLLRKLFLKEPVVADQASVIFRSVPNILFGIMAIAAAIIPSLYANLPLAGDADVIALVGLFAAARVLASLAAMDLGTAFGSMGARRELMVGFLAEPALLMVVFTTSLTVGSTALPTIAHFLAQRSFLLSPSMAFSGVAFFMVMLAENGRIPVDNPTTHLEVTMIHEAMILEYSGPDLALIEWASALKFFNYACIGFALFLPWGLAAHLNAGALILAVPILIVKLMLAGAAIALVEMLSAKLRIFRAPEFLVTGFLVGVLGLLVRLLLGS